MSSAINKESKKSQQDKSHFQKSNSPFIQKEVLN